MSNNVDEQQQTAAKKHNQGGADLEKVTDFAEEQELNATDSVTEGMKKLQEQMLTVRAEQESRAKELAAVSIKTEDIDLIVMEMEVSNGAAELRLRENGGDVVKAITSMLLA